MLIVDKTSWHYRIYDHWRNNIARKSPATIDLCHYMRAILLFTPGYYVGLSLLIAAISVFYALCATVALVTVPLWGPVWLVTHNRSWHKRGARRVGNAIGGGVHRVALRVERWLEEGGPWVLAGIGVIMLAALFVVLTSREWWLGLAWFGAVGGTIVAVAALIVGLVAFFEWYGPRWRTKRAAKLERDLAKRMARRPAPPKGPSWLSLMWSFLKAKKRRICPLIQVNEGRPV